MLHYETVEPRTLDLLKELQSLPELSDMRLVGGTALALQLGHRVSVDLDLFGTFDSQISLRRILSSKGHVVEGSESGVIQTLVVDGVKLDIVNYPYPWLSPPLIEDGIILAEINDIMAMKISAAANRGKKKDFIDIATLLESHSLAELFRAYQTKYSLSDIAFALRGLTYFDDAETDPPPRMISSMTWREAKSRIQNAVRQFVQLV